MSTATTILLWGLGIGLLAFAVLSGLKWLDRQPDAKSAWDEPTVDLNSPEMNRQDDIGGPR